MILARCGPTMMPNIQTCHGILPSKLATLNSQRSTIRSIRLIAVKLTEPLMRGSGTDIDPLAKSNAQLSTLGVTAFPTLTLNSQLSTPPSSA